jgi:hypothetical protein
MTGYIKWLELVAALAALVNWKKIKTNKLAKNLAILILTITLLEFLGYATKFYQRYNIVFYNFVVEPLVFALYAYAFGSSYLSAKFKKFAGRGFVILMLIYFSTFSTIDYTKYLNIIGYDIGALFVACLSVLAISEVIDNADTIDFFKQPLIYLLLAIIFYYLTTIPHFTVAYYFYINKIKNDSTVILSAVNTALNYLLYLFYVIYFITWDRKKQQY